MNVLKSRIEEIEYENKMLKENYKVPNIGVRTNDSLKQLARRDEEIDALKRELERLRKQGLVKEEVRGVQSSDEYLKDELIQAQETIERLEGNIFISS